MAAARPAPDSYPVDGARALAPEQEFHMQAASAAEPVPEPAARRAPYQPALFPSRDLGRVVPIEAYQVRASERRDRAKQAESSPGPVVATGSAAQQGDLPFSTAAIAAAARSPKPLQPQRYSKAPVAIPAHRIMAAAIDFAMMAVAAGAVCLVIAFGANNGSLPGQPLAWFGGAAAALALAYKLVWAAAESDSPGLRWCQLKLLHFDGREPSRRERLERIAWSLMSIMPAGLGLVWALADEESLSWHDHSSKTFLTPFSR